MKTKVIALALVLACFLTSPVRAAKNDIDVGFGVYVAPGLNYLDTTVFSQAFDEIQIGDQLFEDVTFIVGSVNRIVKKKNNGNIREVWTPAESVTDGEMNFLLECDIDFVVGAGIARNCLGFIVTNPAGTFNVQRNEPFTTVVNIPRLRQDILDTQIDVIGVLRGVTQIGANAEIIAYNTPYDSVGAGLTSFTGWYDVTDSAVIDPRGITGPNGRPVSGNNQLPVPPGQTGVFWSWRGDQITTQGVVGGIGRVMVFIIDTRPKTPPPPLAR